MRNSFNVVMTSILHPTETKFEDKWDRGDMKPITLRLLHQQSVSKQEWQNLFWDVHHVCSWDDRGSAKLYEALRELILSFISGCQLRVLGHQDDAALLRAYINEWVKFFAQCQYLPKPYMNLGQNYKSSGSSTTQLGSTQEKSKDGMLVEKLMLDSWNESIFSSIKGRLQDSAMKLIHSERSGEAFDIQLVIGVRESYVNLSSDADDHLKIYRDNFENAYLTSTRTFYKGQASQHLADNGVRNYMNYAAEKLKEEDQRAMRYLEMSKGSDSLKMLHHCTVEVLLTDFKDQILAECPMMITRNETDKLYQMYCLMNEVESGIDPMRESLEFHITQDGLADMEACADTITTDPEKYVEKLLELFTRYSKLVKSAFHDDHRFLTSRDKAYKTVVNDTHVFRLELPTKQKTASKTQPESRCPELLANYCDLLLRKSGASRKLTSDEIESRLRDVLLILKYVQNKDVFMRYHKSHLTRRLILDTSTDSEKEENMVEWLREVGMPADYVNKLARMFQDMKVSGDLNQEFQEKLKEQSNSVADIVTLKVLNAGAWSRGSERTVVSLPMELEDFIPDVEEFYRQKHNGRKLQWHHHMSNGVITFVGSVGKFDLEVTTFQMAVLFAWNQRPHDKLSLEDLRLSTELPEGELKRTLWSLVAFPKLKHQLLLCEPTPKSPRDFLDHSLFRINHDFVIIRNGKVQKRGKFNFIGRLQLSTETSRQEENEGIVALRVLRVQEAIVKIMKMRKKLTNAALQTELVEMLKNMFLPQKKMIKEQIEWLIEHKYMKREDDDLNTFVYLA